MEPSIRYEQLIAYLGSQLPAPVDQQSGPDDSIVFTGGEPAEVVVHLSSTSVTVFEFACHWERPASLVARPRRVGMLKWRRLSETVLLNALGTLIKGARDMRLARYGTCGWCGIRKPPEMMADADICRECADQQTEVVH